MPRTTPRRLPGSSAVASSRARTTPTADGDAEGGLNLGRLKATDGAFNYEIPPGTNVGAYRSVIVWCQRFTVLFATAPLGAV